MTENRALIAIKNVSLILIVIDVFAVADKHPVAGTVIAAPLAVLLFWSILRYAKLNPEPCCGCGNCGCKCHSMEGWDG